MKANDPSRAHWMVTAPARSVVPPVKIPFYKKVIASGIMRFAGWWSIFAGVLALNSVCPVCGSTACPVGIGTTGIIAAAVAAVKQWGEKGIRIIFSWYRKRYLKDTGSVQNACSCGSCHKYDHHD